MGEEVGPAGELGALELGVVELTLVQGELKEKRPCEIQPANTAENTRTIGGMNVIKCNRRHSRPDGTDSWTVQLGRVGKWPRGQRIARKNRTKNTR